MLKFYKNADKKALLLAVLLFACFALLACLFPYSGDDWAWGSEIGTERLGNWFEDYNGRYAGNLLVMVLTRCKPLCAAVVAAGLTLSVLLPALFAGKRDYLTLALGAALLLLMPKDVFVQAVVWTSGFSNYVPPVLLTLSYFAVMKNIFSDTRPEYGPVTSLFCLGAGFVGALFMENITVFNILAAAFIVGYSFFRFKRVYASQLFYLSGSVAGAVLMFTNSAYSLIANQGDFYRSFFYERGFTDTVTENIKESFERLFATNTVTLALLSLLCTVSALVFVKGGAEGRKRKAVLSSLCVNIVCLAVGFCKGRLDDWELFYNNRGYAVASSAVFLAVAVLYFISTAVIIYFCTDDKQMRRKALFLQCCIPAVIAPLMLVNPIGPRCFFPPCLFLSCLCAVLFSYLRQKGLVGRGNQRLLCSLLTCVICVVMSFLTAVYGIIRYYDKTRNEYIKKQADEGFKTAVAYYLPFTSYVWNGDPDSVPWDESYKKFYGIDEAVEFKFILWDAFESFKGNFEKQ